MCFSELSFDTTFDFQLEEGDSKSNRGWTCLLLKSNTAVSKVREQLESNGIQTSLLWYPLHCQPVFKDATRYLNGTAEKLFKKGVTLPSNISLESSFFKRITAAILDQPNND